MKFSIPITCDDCGEFLVEVDKDFPVLHGLAVVALWSWLENFVKGFVVLWLTHRKDAYSATVLQKLRVKLGAGLKRARLERTRSAPCKGLHFRPKKQGQISRGHRGRREAVSRALCEILPERKSLTVSSRL